MMRAMLAYVLVLTTLLGGCATTGGKIGLGIGIAATVGAVVTAREVNCADGGACLVRIMGTGGLALVAITSFVAALVSESIGAAYAEPTSAAREPQAIDLAREAVRAAHAGRCADANTFALRLRAVDRAFYERLIAADRPLASCRDVPAMPSREHASRLALSVRSSVGGDLGSMGSAQKIPEMATTEHIVHGASRAVPPCSDVRR